MLGVSQAGFALSYWHRLRGLLARPALVVNQVLLIKPCSSIHTFFMVYAIDVVFLNDNNRVLRIASSVKPWRVRYCARADYVAELSAGACKQLNLQIGDECRWSC